MKFGNNVHNYLKNQEMLCILKYFSFLCQSKGHDKSNKLVMKDFDLKFGYKNGFLEDSEALCMCPCSFGFIFLNSKLSSKKIKELFINFHTFHFRPRYLPKYVDMLDFPPNYFFLGYVEALHQISASQVECKWKKSCFLEGQSFHTLSNPVLSIDQDLVSRSDKIFLPTS